MIPQALCNHFRGVKEYGFPVEKGHLVAAHLFNAFKHLYDSRREAGGGCYTKDLKVLRVDFGSSLTSYC